MSGLSSARLLLVATCLLLLSTAAHPVAARDACYADCSDGLSAQNDRGPAAGETAPRFTAALYDSVSGDAIERTLDALLDGRPVILAFGSYT